MIFFRRVEGNSMEPTLRDGQIVWAHEIRMFRPGQVVIAFVDGREIVKRIISIENGKVTLSGDNKQATNSYVIADSKIEGVVFWPRVAK